MPVAMETLTAATPALNQPIASERIPTWIERGSPFRFSNSNWYLRKRNDRTKFMTTVTLEVNDEQDLHLLLTLAQRLNLPSTVVNEEDETRYEAQPDGTTLTVGQLRQRLAEAEHGEGISLHEFSERLQSGL